MHLIKFFLIVGCISIINTSNSQDLDSLKNQIFYLQKKVDYHGLRLEMNTDRTEGMFKAHLNARVHSKKAYNNILLSTFFFASYYAIGRLNPNDGSAKDDWNKTWQFIIMVPGVITLGKSFYHKQQEYKDHYFLN
jgi:hypothetical protein